MYHYPSHPSLFFDLCHLPSSSSPFLSSVVMRLRVKRGGGGDVDEAALLLMAVVAVAEMAEGNAVLDLRVGARK